MTYPTDNYLQIRRKQRSRNWTSEAVMRAIKEEAYYSKSDVTRQKAWDKIGCQLNFDSDERGGSLLLNLDYIGNRDILTAVEMVSLICHKADEAFFAEQAKTVIEAARNGCVVVSAFISPKEREVRRMLMNEHLPIVEIRNNGFGTNYRPSGYAYDAVVSGKLLQITPWVYVPEADYKLSREMCLIMNELARVISKCPDHWWKRD